MVASKHQFLTQEFLLLIFLHVEVYILLKFAIFFAKVQWIYENSSWCLGPPHSMDWKFPTEDLWNLFKTQEEEEAVENNIAFEALSTQQKYDISSW